MLLIWRFRRLLASALTQTLLWTLLILVMTSSLLLPLYLGITFLSVRNCHPYKDISFPAGALSALEFNVAPGNETEEDKTLLELFLPADITVELQNANISNPILPRHLLQSGSVLLSSWLSRYSLADAASYCQVNGIKAPGILSLGIEVCSETLQENLGSRIVHSLQLWLNNIQEGLETNIVRDILDGNLSDSVKKLPGIFSTEGKFET